MKAASPKTTTAALTAVQKSAINPPSKTWSTEDLEGGKRKNAVEKYVKMLENDIYLQQALRLASNIVINLIGEYQHEDDSIADFVNQALHHTRGSYQGGLRHQLKALLVGYAVAEKLFGRVIHEGRELWAYEAIVPIKPETVARGGIVVEQALGQPEEIVQYPKSEDEIHIPGAKCVHWAWEDDGSGYGLGAGKALLPMWEAADEAFGDYKIGLRRLAMNLLYERVPNTKMEMGQQEKSYLEIVEENWSKTLGGSVVLRPVSEEWQESGLPEVDVIEANEFDEQFLNFFRYVHDSYFLAFGIPPLLMMEPEHASRAQSQVQAGIAKYTLVPIAEEFAELCLMRDLVVPLLQVNFGDLEDYGEFAIETPLDEESFARMLEAFSKSGVMGMMVDERIYGRLQEMAPNWLPPIEDTELAGNNELPTEEGTGISEEI